MTLSIESGLPTRILGRNGPRVSAIGLGCMGMSEFYGTPNLADCLATLRKASDLGCTFWDTADVYGNGHNESLLGEAIRMCGREKIFICTKFGYDRERGVIDGSPTYVKRSCHKSLQRLQLECIDLYYQNRVDHNTPIEETVRAMAELVKEGKVKYIGLSEVSAETLRRAHKIHPISALQVEYSPWSRDIENNGVLQTCRELGVAVVAYSPLGRGFFTGTIRYPPSFEESDYRRALPRFDPINLPFNLNEIYREVKNWSEDLDMTPAQLCLAWLLSKGPDIIPIPGCRNKKRLKENLKAVKSPMTRETSDKLSDTLKKCRIFGERYEQWALATIDK
ncbi:aldo/keto reductase [Planoprotostelium fungivorum]|uniref:Aldo/keto reductase n=1 Tax=Planoprotostelium fungivorum TaxID=1890364 RepID=A0A2P6NNH9_9EUKA|nr:aldo/keto reductase [Planoprotostelium fungivorum]